MRCLLRVLGAAAIIAVLVMACAPSTPAVPTTRKINLDLVVKDAPYAHYFVAKEKGYYAEEGLDVEIGAATGNTGVAGLLSGESEFTTSASSALSAILKGGQLKIVFSHMDRPAYELWSNQADVRSLRDLPGKSIAIGGRGDTMEVSTRLVLAKAGLDPDSVAYTALGPGGGRLAALQSGSVAAAVLGIGDAQRFRQTNPSGHLLSDVAQDVRMQLNGIATSDRLLAQDPGLVERFLRATIKGREYVRQYREETLDIIGKYNGATREVNGPDLDSVLATMTANGTLPDDVQASDARVRAGIVGATSVRPMSEIYDYRLVRKIYAELKQSGWQPRR